MSIIGVLRYLQSKSASECLSMKSGFFEDFHWNNLHRKFLLETFQWVWFKTSSFKSFINSVLFWVLFEFFSKIIVQLLIVTYYAIRIFKIQFWIPKLIAQKLSANLWTRKCSSSTLFDLNSSLRPCSSVLIHLKFFDSKVLRSSPDLEGLKLRPSRDLLGLLNFKWKCCTPTRWLIELFELFELFAMWSQVVNFFIKISSSDSLGYRTTCKSP